jgi:hypothetical protein
LDAALARAVEKLVRVLSLYGDTCAVDPRLPDNGVDVEIEAKAIGGVGTGRWIGATTLIGEQGSGDQQKGKRLL